MRCGIDAGHNHDAHGASHAGLREEVLTADIANRVGHYLRAAGAETVFTRPAKGNDLAFRVRRAVQTGCHCFASIHFNSGGGLGTEAFVVQGDTRSHLIAQRVLAAVCANWTARPEPVGAMLLQDRGVKWDTSSHVGRLAVLRGTYKVMPALLWEVAFLDGDEELCRNNKFLERVSAEFAGALLVQLSLPKGGGNP
jgi:N-acetylmuramoyl-L-alanine amidase